MEELNETEMKKVRKRIDEHKHTILMEWPRIILDNLHPYKQAQLINGHELAKAITTKRIMDLVDQPVYCGIFFMKAGRQHTVVRHQDKIYV